MYKENIEKLKKDFMQLDLYDLKKVTKFSLKLLNLNLELSENININIESFSISSIYENIENKYIYLIDINYLENENEFTCDIEEFMKSKFNLELEY
jgi:hypothetical protein